MKIILNLILIISLSTSCGWLNEDVEEKPFETNQVTGLCEMKTDDLSKITDQIITDSLRCIQSNLEKFAKLVKRENQKNIKQNELSQFVQALFGQKAKGYIDGIIIMFQINAIFLQDKHKELQVKNIKPLFDSLVVLNELLVEISSAFFDVQSFNYEQKRKTLKTNTEKLITRLIDIIGTDGRDDRYIDIYDLVERLKNEIGDQDEDNNGGDFFEKITSFLKLKMILVGGDAKNVTAKEFRTFLDMFPEFSLIIYDLIALPTDEDQSESEQVELITNIIKSFDKLTDNNGVNHSTHVLNRSDLEEIANKNDLDEYYQKFSNTIDQFREHFLLTTAEEITFYEFKSTLTILQFILPLFSTYYQIQPFPEDFKNLDFQTRLDFFNKINNGLIDWKEKTNHLINKGTFPKSANLRGFLKGIEDDFDFDVVNLKQIQSFLPLKRVFIDDNIKTWVQKDWNSVQTKAPTLFKAFFDLLYLSDRNGKENYNKFLLFTHNIKRVRNLFAPIDDTATLLSFKEIFLLLDSFQDKLETIKFIPTFKNLWRRLFRRHADEITLREGDWIIDKFISTFEKISFNSFSFSIHPRIQIQTNVIKNIELKSDPFYENFNGAKYKEYKTELTKILSRHRYYLNKEDGKAVFDYPIVRKEKGLITLTWLKVILEEFIAAYMTKDELVRDDRNIKLNRKELEDLLFEFKSVLEPFGLWSKNPPNFARNTLLMGDLFQHLSNGDMHLDSLEIVDYANSVLAAMNMMYEVLDKYENWCPNVGTADEKAYNVSCYRPKFFAVLLNKLKNNQYLPNLLKFLSASNQKEKDQYLESVEKFARDFPDDRIPMAKRDFALVIGSLINIETAFLRFDTNKDNIIDYEELKKSFLVFKDALIELAELTKKQEKYAESIFFYLIKYKEIPSKTDLFLFHYNPFNGKKKLKAKRLHIGLILYYLVNQ